MDWKELLKAFNDAIEKELDGKSDKEKQAILGEATNELRKEARQFLIDTGFGPAHARQKELETEFTRKEEALNKQLEEAKEAVKNAKGDEALKQRVQQLEDQISTLNTEHDEQVKSLQAGFDNERVDFFVRGVERHLVNTFGVDPVIARSLVGDPDLRKRLRPEDSTVKAYRSAERIQPISTKNGQSLDEALAEELEAGVDARYKKSGVRGGAGVEGGASGGGFVSEAVKRTKERLSGQGNNPLLPQQS